MKTEKTLTKEERDEARELAHLLDVFNSHNSSANYDLSIEAAVKTLFRLSEPPTDEWVVEMKKDVDEADIQLKDVWNELNRIGSLPTAEEKEQALKHLIAGTDKLDVIEDKLHRVRESLAEVH